MKIAQWLNTARIMGILYALFVFSLGSLVYIEGRTTIDNWELFSMGAKMAMWQLFQCAIAGLMMEAWRQHSTNGTISRRIAKGMYWAPRIVWMLIILFTAVNGVLLSIDRSPQRENIWTEMSILAFFLAPAITLGIILALTWRWEWVGAGIISLVVLFLLLEFSYSLLFTQMMQIILLVIIPMVLLATAFWLNWRWRSEIRPVG